MHGKPKLIPITNANVIRPFLTSTKQDLSYWAIKNKLQWIEDESNKDLTLTRNYIRQNIVPHALVVNPGLYKTIFKKVTKCLNKTT
jgi:tRNA(Ile)-lysidine synthase